MGKGHHERRKEDLAFRAVTPYACNTMWVTAKPQANNFFISLYPKSWAPDISQIIKNPKTDIGIQVGD